MSADQALGAGGVNRRILRAQSWLRQHTARVGVRLMSAFLAVSLLIPLVGWVAIQEQYASAARAAQAEAGHVAAQIAQFVTHTDPGRAPLYQDPVGLQAYVTTQHTDQGRDIEVVDQDLRILADAIPANVGRQFTGDGGQVAATLRDGQDRTFTETSADFPHGIELVAVPMRHAGAVVGAILLEYTPIYDTLVAASAPTRRVIVSVSVSGTVAALVLGLLLSHGIVRDLRQLRGVASLLAAGDDTARARLDGQGEISQLAATFNDMADQIAAQKAELAELAGTDPLTGLDNRRSFLSRLHVALTSSHRTGSPVALLMLDVDHFKSINDSHGHAAGDAALQTLAAVLRSDLRPGDRAARLGGEEFAVLLPGTGRADAVAVAERLRAAVSAERFAFGGQPFTLTTSIGVVIYPIHAATADALLQAGDLALYAAKHHGRNRVCEPPPGPASAGRAGPAS
ncbi:GGDEF domain-containing protein [Hamadaea sp. NPDC050747]|uniref:GGDEF domain-containing protein n=1 Tax=Hamadaea sp. NPDC050747 TaxID=3155789 RepID=UPI0033D9C8E8